MMEELVMMKELRQIHQFIIVIVALLGWYFY